MKKADPAAVPLEDGNAAPSPAALRAQIAALQAQLAQHDDVEELVECYIPATSTGDYFRVNGTAYHGWYRGEKALPASLVQTIFNGLGMDKTVDEQRLRPRGNMLPPEDLAVADAVSRIIARRPHRTL